MDANEKYIANLIKSKIYKKNPDAEVILFGSHARGEAHIDSDWDILILLNNLSVNRKTEKEYREELFDIEIEIGQPISTFVFSRNDWESKHSITPLYQNIRQEGISLT